MKLGKLSIWKSMVAMTANVFGIEQKERIEKV